MNNYWLNKDVPGFDFIKRGILLQIIEEMEKYKVLNHPFRHAIRYTIRDVAQQFIACGMLTSYKIEYGNAPRTVVCNLGKHKKQSILELTFDTPGVKSILDYLGYCGDREEIYAKLLVK